MAYRSDSTEKQHTPEHDERCKATIVDGIENDGNFGISPEQQRKIIRRVDRRLVLTVGAMYCVSLMDRTNMSAANIAGMSKELMLIDNRYVSLLVANLPPGSRIRIYMPPRIPFSK